MIAIFQKDLEELKKPWEIYGYEMSDEEIIKMVEKMMEDDKNDKNI